MAQDNYMFATESFEVPLFSDITSGLIHAEYPLQALEKIISNYNNQAPMKTAEISSLGENI